MYIKKIIYRLSPDTHYFTHILELECDVTAACFTNDTDHILIGTATGEITVIITIIQEKNLNLSLKKFIADVGTTL